MEKDKLTVVITIGIMSLILVCVMFAQFKVISETDIAQLESMREDELEQALTEWKEKYEKTFDKLEETNKIIEEYKSKVQSNEESHELIEKELAEAKRIFGLTEITGDGLLITLNDNEDKNYTASDLLDLINELRAAGAKAISINDERIVNITDVVDIGSRYIVINKNKVSAPFNIKVIGDRTYLKSALTIKNGYYDIKQKENYGISIQDRSNIKMDPYNKEVDLKYINNN